MSRFGMLSTLKGKAAVFIIVISAVALGILGTIFFRTQRVLLSEFEREKMGIVEHFMMGTLKPVMLTGHGELMSEIMASYKNTPDVKELKIIRTNGVEAFTDGETMKQVNERLDEKRFHRNLKPPVQAIPPDEPMLREVIGTGEKKVYSKKTADGGRITYLMFPILNEEACHGCHGSDHPLRGVFLASFGMTRTDQRTLNNMYWLAGIAFALLVVTAILTYLFINKILASRVTSVVRQVNTLVTENRFDRRITIDAHDEVGQLAVSFNHFIAAVENYQINEEEEKGRLEKAVFDKTKELREKNAFIETDLKIASRIQQRLMPEKFPVYPEVEFHAAYLPCLYIGGDYYDVFEMPNRHVGIVMADASGHGSSAALLVSIVKAIVSIMGEHFSSPSYIVQIINSTLAKITPDDAFVTMFYGVLDLKTNAMLYSLAGHPPPLVHNRHTGKIETLQSNGGMVGVFDFDKFDDSEYVFKPGDRLFVYTDGIVEASPGEGKNMFGTDRLTETLREGKDATPAEMMKHLLSRLENHTAGTPLADDVTLLVVDFKKG